MSNRIAGHTFISGVCYCGRRWIDIRHLVANDIGEVGYAHTGGLTLTEINEITTERQAEEAAIANANAEARGG